jgi:hypothetical protein
MFVIGMFLAQAQLPTGDDTGHCEDWVEQWEWRDCAESDCSCTCAHEAIPDTGFPYFVQTTTDSSNANIACREVTSEIRDGDVCVQRGDACAEWVPPEEPEVAAEEAKGCATLQTRRGNEMSWWLGLSRRR